MSLLNPEELISSYSKLVERTESTLSQLPEGALYSQMYREKYPQYYRVFVDEATNSKKKVFVKKSDLPFAKKLAQREYSQKFLIEIKKQLSALTHVQKSVDLSSLIGVYEKLSPAKKLLVDPYILPNEQYIEKWRSTSQMGVTPSSRTLVLRRSGKLVSVVGFNPPSEM